MMNRLLKRAGTLPLVLPDVELFLRYAEQMALLEVITVYDWAYLSILINYRIHKEQKRTYTHICAQTGELPK